MKYVIWVAIILFLAPVITSGFAIWINWVTEVTDKIIEKLF